MSRKTGDAKGAWSGRLLLCASLLNSLAMAPWTTAGAIDIAQERAVAPGREQAEKRDKHSGIDIYQTGESQFGEDRRQEFSGRPMT